MTSHVRPASWFQVVPLGWLMARAFTANRVLAVIAAPITVLSLVPFAARRVLYRSGDGNGMVTVGRYRPVLDVVAMLPLSTVIAVAWMAIAGALLRLGAVGLVLVIFVLVVLPVVGLRAVSTSLFQTPVGAETPPGPHWMVANLAQRPGTQLSALLLTRSLIGSLPTGSVVVAVAGSEQLAEGYERMGFARGGGRRVFEIVCPGTHDRSAQDGSSRSSRGPRS